MGKCYNSVPTCEKNIYASRTWLCVISVLVNMWAWPAICVTRSALHTRGAPRKEAARNRALQEVSVNSSNCNASRTNFGKLWATPRRCVLLESGMVAGVDNPPSCASVPRSPHAAPFLPRATSSFVSNRRDAREQVLATVLGHQWSLEFWDVSWACLVRSDYEKERNMQHSPRNPQAKRRNISPRTDRNASLDR